jgi:hypothetical protein
MLTRARWRQAIVAAFGQRQTRHDGDSVANDPLRSWRAPSQRSRELRSPKNSDSTSKRIELSVCAQSLHRHGFAIVPRTISGVGVARFPHGRRSATRARPRCAAADQLESNIIISTNHLASCTRYCFRCWLGTYFHCWVAACFVCCRSIGGEGGHNKSLVLV